VYLPTLAVKILKEDKNLPLAGILIGNPCTTEHDCFDRDYHVGGWLSTNQVEYLHRRGFVNAKDWQDYRSKCLLGYQSQLCKQAILQLRKDFDALNVSINNVYAPCLGSTDCMDYSAAREFLRSPAVKAAMHVDSSISWQECSDLVSSRYAKNESQGFWAYRELVGKVRIVPYSPVDIQR
jgi:hypothetical protein